MSGHNWKPGDVAMCRGEICIITQASERSTEGPVYAEFASGKCLLVDALSTGARPLVVIDPEEREQVERLLRGYAGWKALDGVDSNYVDDMQAALREFAAAPTPPKPDEPQGLGAVVVDANGYHWVRIYAPTGGQWQYLGVRRVYADVDAVEVLSEGVTQ